MPINKWLNSSIHQALTSNSFINYLRTKFNWNHSAHHEVDWQQRITASHKVPKHHLPWLIKLGTNRLPLNGEKFHQSPTVFCSLCKRCNETSDHFLTCKQYPSPTAQQLRDLFTIYNKYNIDPHLRILLTRIIKGLPCDLHHICQAHPTFPITDYKLLLHSQHQIGWINFLKGYPSKQWVCHQRRYITEMYIDEKFTNQNWLPSVYRVLYKTYYERWTLRNQTQHRTDQAYTKQSLLLRISAMYSFQESMHPQDQHCFRKPLK